jgi:hypothetical protein
VIRGSPIDKRRVTASATAGVTQKVHKLNYSVLTCFVKSLEKRSYTPFALNASRSRFDLKEMWRTSLECALIALLQLVSVMLKGLGEQNAQF